MRRVENAETVVFVLVIKMNANSLRLDSVVFTILFNKRGRPFALILYNCILVSILERRYTFCTNHS